MMLRYTFTSRLIALMALDMALGFIYALVPADITALRSVISYVQLAAMIVTMVVATRRVLEEY